MDGKPPSTPTAPRSIWIALVLLAAAIVAVAAGLLAFASGAQLPTALLTGGGAFAGTTAILIALLNFALDKP
jgi:hypothetical protein